MPVTEALSHTLTQAIAFEVQHAYTDVQGKHAMFSQFMQQQVKTLLMQFPDDPDLQKLLAQFKRYSLMDMGQRMACTKTLLQWLNASKITQTSELMAAANTGDTKPYASAVEVADSLLTAAEASSGGKPAQAVTNDTEIQWIKGVGPHLANLLNSVGVFNVFQLIRYYPRRYIDYQHQPRIAQLSPGIDCTVVGTVRSIGVFELPRKPLLLMTLVVGDATGQLTAQWFYGKAQRKLAESQKNRYPKGIEVMLTGHTKWDSYRNQLSIERPQIEILSSDEDNQAFLAAGQTGRIMPIYPLTQGLYLKSLRRCLHNALQQWLPGLTDPMPTHIKQQYGLMDLAESYQGIHFPNSMEIAHTARRRLVFDELFCIQARLQQLRVAFRQTQSGVAMAANPQRNLVELGLSQLPFSLTNGQHSMLTGIFGDMGQPQPMFRLLQGDVGSGKTVVAWLAMLRAVENGFQAALMAPTEILAEQHYQRFVQWLTPMGLRAGLFVGKASSAHRKEARQALENGLIHVAVGTHALIQEGVVFQQLGLVVIDEQHRFGVKQRNMLRTKGQQPHLLSMTATPIPRTLALTMYGDLDIALLKERPPGRSPIITEMVTARSRKSVYLRIREQMLLGRQVYVVFPLIEESEALSAKAATTESERLQQEIFPEFKIGLLHGRMTGEDKAAIMLQFVKKELHILVSTTVIEVGVDVPNATVMWIENAERFGLSQLHQLRGRVGRGEHQSYCFLALDSGQPEAEARLKVLVDTEDGFVIAEHDLALRGPGEFLGTRQSGLPDLLLADLIQDQQILEDARQAAIALTNPGPLPAELQAYVDQAFPEQVNTLAAG
jgi:ATP-dependent DNA helicase RecG